MFKVTLHVYDLSGGMALKHSRQLIGSQINGMWHTGVVIYGKEFYYGGGICYDLPGRTPFGKFFKPARSINQIFCGLGQPTHALAIGETEVPEEIFMEMLRDMAQSKYTKQGYHVVNNNGNTFSDDVAQNLLGEGIPAQYSQLPREFFQT